MVFKARMGTNEKMGQFCVPSFSDGFSIGPTPGISRYSSSLDPFLQNILKFQYKDNQFVLVENFRPPPWRSEVARDDGQVLAPCKALRFPLNPLFNQTLEFLVIWKSGKIHTAYHSCVTLLIMLSSSTSLHIVCYYTVARDKDSTQRHSERAAQI